jgi:hypothetical protein
MNDPGATFGETCRSDARRVKTIVGAAGTRPRYYHSELIVLALYAL